MATGFQVREDFYYLDPNLEGDHQERNWEFYHKPKVQVMYPKELVYPPEGGEYSLEEIRAKMKRYQFIPEPVEQTMDFTCLPKAVFSDHKPKDSFPVTDDLDDELERLLASKEVQLKKGYTFTPDQSEVWTPNESELYPQKVLSFNDSQSYSALTGFSTNNSTVTGTFAVYEDSQSDEVHNSLNVMRKPLAVIGGKAVSSILGDSAVNSFQVYEDSQTSLRSDISTHKDKVANESTVAKENVIIPVVPGGVKHAVEVPTFNTCTADTLLEETVNTVGLQQHLMKCKSTPNPSEKSALDLPSFDISNVTVDFLHSVDFQSHVVPEKYKAPQSRLGVTEFTMNHRNLSTIEEAIENSSSSSGASTTCFTVSGGAKSFASQITSKKLIHHPFSETFVDFMLQGVNPDKLMYEKSENLPPLKAGSVITFDQSNSGTFTIVTKLGVGAYASVYSACNENKEKLALKVFKDVSHVEYFIVREVHERLSNSSDEIYRDLFVDIVKGIVFANQAVLVMPLYEHTLLDVFNKFLALCREGVIAVFAIQLLNAVSALHRMDIIHGDLKPDNIFIDMGRLKSRNFLVVADFNRAIDLRAFPDDVVFTGKSNTSCFECIQMQKDEPWKYQIDTYSLAVTIHTMIQKDYNFHYTYDEAEKRYKYTKRISRSWNRNEWMGLFNFLLNTSTNEPLKCSHWIEIFRKFAKEDAISTAFSSVKPK